MQSQTNLLPITPAHGFSSTNGWWVGGGREAEPLLQARVEAVFGYELFEGALAR